MLGSGGCCVNKKGRKTCVPVRLRQSSLVGWEVIVAAWLPRKGEGVAVLDAGTVIVSKLRLDMRYEKAG